MVSWVLWSRFCALWNLNCAFPGYARIFIMYWHGLSPSAGLHDFWMLSFGAIIWSIWLCRNEILFKGKSLDVNQLFDLILYRIGTWAKAKWPSMILNIADFVRSPKEALYVDAESQCKKMGGDQRRKQQGIQFFVDAAKDSISGLAGIGGVLRKDSGEAVIRFSKQLGAIDITTAEILAIKEARMILKRYRWPSSEATIFSDCANAVSWANNPMSAPGAVKELVKDCMLIGGDSKWTTVHVPREQNTEADELAKIGIHHCAYWCNSSTDLWCKIQSGAFEYRGQIPETM